MNIAGLAFIADPQEIAVLFAGVLHNGTIYTYLHNLQGDIVGIVDSTGAIVVEYKYNAWGSSLSKTGTMANTLGSLNPFRYRGYVYDEQTWMYWVMSRYYYPELYRFICGDVLISSSRSILNHHIYAYCINNPVMHADPSGFDAIDAEGGSCGSARRNINSGNERNYQKLKKNNEKLIQQAKRLNTCGGIITFKNGVVMYCYPKHNLNLSPEYYDGPKNMNDDFVGSSTGDAIEWVFWRHFPAKADVFCAAYGVLSSFSDLKSAFELKSYIRKSYDNAWKATCVEAENSEGYLVFSVPRIGEYTIFPWTAEYYTPDNWNYMIESITEFE